MTIEQFAKNARRFFVCSFLRRKPNNRDNYSKNPNSSIAIKWRNNRAKAKKMKNYPSYICICGMYFVILQRKID